MPKFSYKVRDREDKVVLGTMEGINADEVADRLSQRDMLPILVEEIGLDGLGSRKTFRDRLNEGFATRKDKVPYKTVVFFTRQLATMVGQGVPLARALEQLQKGEKPVFQRIIRQVAEDISTGLTLSEAISRHPGAFNPMYIAVTHSGEVTGSLDRVLDSLAVYMENLEIMRGKVKTAMRYPVFIGTFVGLIMTGVMIFLVPMFKKIYEGLNASLPLPTQLLMHASDLIKGNWLVCLGLLFLGLVSFKYLMTHDNFKMQVEKYLLRVPVFGEILKRNIWATYCRTMSMLLEAGTPILKATEIAGATVNNRFFSRGLDRVYSSLRKGELLSDSLEASGLFPVLVVQLVSTGETGGQVDTLLRKAAEFYEREIRNVVDSLSSLIEPVLIVALGGIVGSILISLYLPIFMVGQFMK